MAPGERADKYIFPVIRKLVRGGQFHRLRAFVRQAIDKCLGAILLLKTIGLQRGRWRPLLQHSYGIIHRSLVPTLFNAMQTICGALKFSFVVSFICSLVPTAVVADPPGNYHFQTYDRGLEKARTSNKKVFIYFGREGCGFCEVTNKKAFSDSTVHKRYQGNYELVYVDSESGTRLTLPSGERITEHDLGTRYKAFVTPVFVYLEPGGEQILKRVGIQTKEQLLAYDVFVQQEHYKQQTFEQYEKSEN